MKYNFSVLFFFAKKEIIKSILSLLNKSKREIKVFLDNVDRHNL